MWPWLTRKDWYLSDLPPDQIWHNLTCYKTPTNPNLLDSPVDYHVSVSKSPFLPYEFTCLCITLDFNPTSVVQAIPQLVHLTVSAQLDCYIAIYTNMSMCEMGEMDIECWLR